MSATRVSRPVDPSSLPVIRFRPEKEYVIESTMVTPENAGGAPK
jgi:hypothetical protein